MGSKLDFSLIFVKEENIDLPVFGSTKNRRSVPTTRANVFCRNTVTLKGKYMELDKEILDDFRTESSGLVNELEMLVNELEDSEGGAFPTEKLKDFSQKIDRIMGAAKTLLGFAPGHTGIAFLASVSEMCKTMGYQAAALQRVALVPIFAGFWAEVVEVMRDVLQQLDSETNTKLVIEKRSTTLQKRLAWLADKVAPGSEEEKQKVVAMLRKL